jgi:UDP:flavonoid glycosyltransferase YjiC (YdhE family)
MARILIAVWPFAGHINPGMALALALRARGHEVAFYTGASACATVEAEGFACFTQRNVDTAAVERLVLAPGGIIGQPGPLRRKALWRSWVLDTIPGQMADLAALSAAWPPELIVCDPTLWAPFLIFGEQRAIPVTIFGLIPSCPLPGREGPLLGVPLPRPRTWLGRAARAALRGALDLFLADLRRDASRLREAHGLPVLKGSVTEHGGRMPLYLVPGSPELDYNRGDLPPSVRYIGPCIWNKPSGLPAPGWLAELPADRPLVYVTEGTINLQPRIMRAAAAGLAGRPVEVVMTSGRHRRPEELDLGPRPLAPNIRVEQWVALDDLLPHMSALVTNGGPSTLLAALLRGLPVVIVPSDWDHPETAYRVEAMGAGIRIPPGRCTPERLRGAVEQVLTRPHYRRNAERVAQGLERCGGPARAAELLEAVLGQSAALTPGLARSGARPVQATPAS